MLTLCVHVCVCQDVMALVDPKEKVSNGPVSATPRATVSRTL